MSAALDPRATLLADLDGDGFADALVGEAWIGTGGVVAGADAGLGAGSGVTVDAAVAAAAELLGALGSRALRLQVSTRVWETPRPALFFGVCPPGGPLPVTSSGLAEDATRALAPGACAVLSVDGLLLAAEDGPSLGATARALALLWAPPPGGQPRPSLDGEPGEVSDGSLSPLSLGGALAGGGLYSGPTEFPQRFVGGFRSTAGIPEALEVAARLATVALEPAVPMTADASNARVHVGIDPALEAGQWAVRVARGHTVDGLEVVGADAEAVRVACHYVARGFPRLPDGSSLDELERDLLRFLRLETRAGRLAAAAVAGTLASATARSTGGSPAAAGPVRAYALPYPGHDAPLRLGAPVRNSARDGEVRRWSHDAPWEGDRLLDAAAALPLPDGPFDLEVYASEALPLRRQLAQQLAARLASAGHEPGRVHVRHAYKPALHWLVEEIGPALPSTTRVLEVHVGRQEDRYGVAERWLRELYPASDLLQRLHPGVETRLLLDEDAGPPRYRVRALDASGGLLYKAVLTPPVTPSPRLAGEPALSTTAAVRAVVGGRVLAETRVPTDREEAWSFLAREVFPELAREAQGREPPFLHEIAVILHVSEPDDRLDLDHETDSVLEGLHEDIYFGLLEAYAAVRPEHGPRHLAPARILPFCHASPGEATRVRVVARGPGSEAVTVWPSGGRPLRALPLDVNVRGSELVGQGRAPATLVLAVDGAPADAEAALDRLAWGAERGLAPMPGGLALAFRAGGRERCVSPAAVDAPERPRLAPPLPARPLHPHEVVRYARHLAARHPGVHLRVAHESILGQPLVALETGYPAGPDVSRARRARWTPSVLISARQHANEPTSTQAVLALLTAELERPDLMRALNLVVHPLENPDGARLHAALCSLAPNHMHHAARYTAFGADLQTDPELDGRLIGESAQRRDAWRRWRPLVHLNNHGYPAHEWVRPQTGYVPAGFANWSLPVGHLTILTVRHAPTTSAEALADALRERVATALDAEPTVADLTRSQVARSGRYRPLAATPFRFARGLPFWETVTAPEKVDDDAFAPALTVITEVPDETVDGARWRACGIAHRRIDEAVLAVLAEALASSAGPPGTPERLTLAPLLAWARSTAAVRQEEGGPTDEA